MKLIREDIQDTKFIVEEKLGKGKQYYIEGIFLQSNLVNRNKRMYSEEIMDKEVARYLKEQVETNRAYGELGHPDTPSINLHRVSHLIVGLRKEGTNYIGKAKILETPMGVIARQLIEGGGQLGVSSRGMGSLKNVNGVNVVQPDFYLATAADIVADPSAPGAFVQGIMEGKEWMLVNGVWTEVDHSQAITEVKKASKKDIEKVSLRIFENFIKKL